MNATAYVSSTPRPTKGPPFFDTADVYGMGLPEEVLGKALRTRRDEVLIATKFGREMSGTPAGEGASAEWARASAEASMRRLGTDYIDLFCLHIPEENTPIGETMAALSDLVREGKVKAIGTSAVDNRLLTESDRTAQAGGFEHFSFVQNEYSLLDRDIEDNVLPACLRMGVGFIPYFPLASGVLAGAYMDPDNLPERARLSQLTELRSRYLNASTLPFIGWIADFAASIDRSMSRVAIGWLLSRPGVISAIAGATSEEQVLTNAKAATNPLSSRD